ncbi:hypothetical protein QTP70_034827, partial [Hemibagrus guttatus]
GLADPAHRLVPLVLSGLADPAHRLVPLRLLRLVVAAMSSPGGQGGALSTKATGPKRMKWALELSLANTSTNFTPDRSRPGLTMTAIGAVDLQGAGGNWATVGGRSRGGRRVRRQREKRKGKSVGLRIGTLNVGTMTGKGRELADVMERRKVDILCVQESRWKGSKARSIGAGFKLFYYGVDSKRNGVGVVLKEEFVRNVLEVKRVSDRVMSLKLEIEGVMLNVVSGYAPQVGCELEEKERFWSELDEVMESIPTGERVVIGADFNGHVGEVNTGDEEVMGKFGVKERNLEGQMVVDFAKRMDMAVVNTYFQKREEHRVTYKSGGRSTQVDYILCRRGNLKEISDCKVVVGESVDRQHRMMVCRMTLLVCKKKRSEIEIEKKTKWWKLKKEECCEEFRQKLRQALGGQVVLPDDWETTAEVIRETGRKVLGVSSGRRKEDKETWWWNEEVQDSIQRKRLAKKKWDMDRTEENRQEYKELQRRVKREVSKAKQKAYDELYTRLDTREGEKDLYRLARQRDRDGKDVQQVRVIKDRDGRVLTSEESEQRRWKEYFEDLMNEENEREKRVEGVNSVEQKVDKIRKDEVRKALKRMKSGKAVGPDDIPVEVWKCLGEAAVEFLASLFNRVLESERMPEEWRRSVLVPIFKNKGDVQSCSNYRGIILMSHTMKLWERVVEARLRKVVEICEQQYGFMPRKSTTDAIFALRILMEKYRDGQKELHCVFVDLEKAYDRVPREELWYCMRKSGIAEKYVRVVQDMYERSRTVVRCAVGQTEEFKVEVGLHQGSALSPFLFAIVMDQLSEEVRQESPWTMMFADDIVICSESREQVEENLERWRFALERRGMKVSRSKTEYMCVNEREGSGTVRLQGEEVKKVQEFKYLGSTVQSNGECGKEVKKRVQAAWNGWRKVSGVLCDRKISARIKGKVYRTVVRPAMLYGLETVSLRKRQESELEVAELKMLRTRGDRQLKDGEVMYPVGYSDKPVPDTSVQEADRNLVEKRCWDVALGPLKQIPMNLFIMYMSGNTISIFPIMMVCMMAWRPIQALMSMSATFKLLESSSQQWLQGTVYLIGNLLGSALAIYKCQSMGLLPTHSSDWLAFIEPPQAASEHFVLKVDVLKAGKMDKRKDLSEFDKDQIVMARPLNQSISKTAALVGCSRSAVVSIYQKWSKEGTVVNQRQGHGWSRLIDAHGELRLARVIRSNRRAPVAQIAEEVNAGSDRKVSEYTVHD